MDILYKVLKDSSYNLTLFKAEYINNLQNRVVEKGNKYFITCLIRNKEVQLKPEEIVRQLYLDKLTSEYLYPKERIRLEHKITFGRQTKSADIVVMDKDRPTVEYIIVEVKKPKLKEGKEQLKSYTNATGAPIAVWTNGSQVSHYNRKDPNYFEDITDIPSVSQSLSDILKDRFTLKDLIVKDKILTEGKTLKQIIEEMEDEVLANAGVDVFDVDNFKALPGSGVYGIVNGKEVFIGNRELMAQIGVSSSCLDKDSTIRDFESYGNTVVFTVWGGVIRGAFVISDIIRDEVSEVVGDLKGRFSLSIVSGDNRLTTTAIGGKVGIGDIISEASPIRKMEVIGNLQRNGDRVMMVGDGINDAPGLTQAAVGLAMGRGTVLWIVLMLY